MALERFKKNYPDWDTVNEQQGQDGTVLARTNLGLHPVGLNSGPTSVCVARGLGSRLGFNVNIPPGPWVFRAPCRHLMQPCVFFQTMLAAAHCTPEQRQQRRPLTMLRADTPNILPMRLSLCSSSWVSLVSSSATCLRRKAIVVQQKPSKMWRRKRLRRQVNNLDSFFLKGLMSTFLLLFKILFIYFQREGKGGRKRGRETSLCRCLSHAPYWGPGLQPRPVPCLRIELSTFWCTGQHSDH